MRKIGLVLALTPALAMAAEPVNVENFVRAETDTMIRGTLGLVDGNVGQLLHLRQPTALDQQTVIRMNRDTLYSAVILDLSSPVEVTIPDTGGRYLSMHVIDQDHYMFVITEPGVHTLTEELVGTRFASVSFRVFADPNSEEDVAAANRVQDGLAVSGGGSGPFEAPDWNQDDLLKARSALNELATLGFDASDAFGRKDEVQPVDYLVGAAAGWGGLPSYAAEYVIDSVSQNDGKTPYAITARDVPVDAFWSVTVYNADGYLEPNERGVYSYNGVTATPNKDGSHTIHFGACDDGRINCIPITPGWNYAARMYQPGEEIQSGAWVFPTPQPTD